MKVVELFPETPEAIRRQEANVIAQAIFDARVETVTLCIGQLEKCLLDLLAQDADVLGEALYHLSAGPHALEITDLTSILRKVSAKAKFGGRV